MIEMKGISKTYRVRRREAGLGNALKSLVSRDDTLVPALQNMSFTVPDGQILGYIGPNGAGKSTTIKILSGILRPDSGTCTVDGLTPWEDRKKHVARLGVVFGQRSQLWWDVPVMESFLLLRDIYRVGEREFRENLDRLTELLDLGELLRTPARMLSLGQRMRCEIAAALLHGPRVLFLDEPTIGLDPVMKENIRALIRQMNRELGTTIFLTSHDVGDIEKLCRRIIIVNSGRIVLDDSMDHLKHHYLNRKIVEAKLGEETALPAAEGITLLKQRGSQVRFQVDTGRLPINEALHLIDAENLEDINISNIPLETIITDIYKAEGREEKAV